MPEGSQRLRWLAEGLGGSPDGLVLAHDRHGQQVGLASFFFLATCKGGLFLQVVVVSGSHKPFYPSARGFAPANRTKSIPGRSIVFWNFDSGE